MLRVGPRPSAPMALSPHAQEDTWFAAMNRFLATRHPDANEPGSAVKGAVRTERLWEVFLRDVMAGLTEVSPDLLVRVLVELVANYWSWPGGGGGVQPHNPRTS